jgi:hypothetical protein
MVCFIEFFDETIENSANIETYDAAISDSVSLLVHMLITVVWKFPCHHAFSYVKFIS